MKKSYVSEGIDVNKSDICHYRYFLDKSFKYEPYLSSGSHDLMEKAVIFNDVAVVSAKRSNYRIHICFISKNDAINLLNNSVLSNK